MNQLMTFENCLKFVAPAATIIVWSWESHILSWSTRWRFDFSNKVFIILLPSLFKVLHWETIKSKIGLQCTLSYFTALEENFLKNIAWIKCLVWSCMWEKEFYNWKYLSSKITKEFLSCCSGMFNLCSGSSKPCSQH